MTIRKAAFAAMMVLAACGPAVAQTMTVVSGEGCGCCREWLKHVQAAGYDASITYVAPEELMRHKEASGISAGNSSCHTGSIGGYVIEGHVPAREIARLLAEKPDAIGLAVPGMPYGSPGMGPPEEADPYEVLLVKKDGTTSVFARYP